VQERELGVGVFPAPPEIVSCDLFRPLLTLKYKIHFLGSSIHRADSVTSDSMVVIKKIVNRRDLQFNVRFKSQWGPGILNFPKVLSLAEVKASVSENTIPQRNLTGD
jgi:hypothetical protein